MSFTNFKKHNYLYNIYYVQYPVMKHLNQFKAYATHTTEIQPMTSAEGQRGSQHKRDTFQSAF